MNFSDRENIISAFISSHFDQCNSLFICFCQEELKLLQRVQKAAPRDLTKTT